MPRKSSKSTFDWLKEVSGDILKRKKDIDGAPYWNKHRSLLVWVNGSSGGRPVALSILNKAGILKREVIGRKSSFFGKIHSSFLDRGEHARFLNIHVYKIVGMERLRAIAEGREDAPISLGLTFGNVMRPVEITYPEAIARIKQELSKNPSRDTLFAAIVRELAKT